jgi:isocitrate/isopropylmalate dehydrogenase
LKAPITTPSGGGYKSLNVTIRKTLGLYANVRPCHQLPLFRRLQQRPDVAGVESQKAANQTALFDGQETIQNLYPTWNV